nr:unnamed protein product [Spirometra erinaceieuropaei]
MSPICRSQHARAANAHRMHESVSSDTLGPNVPSTRQRLSPAANPALTATIRPVPTTSTAEANTATTTTSPSIGRLVSHHPPIPTNTPTSSDVDLVHAYPRWDRTLISHIGLAGHLRIHHMLANQ